MDFPHRNHRQWVFTCDRPPWHQNIRHLNLHPKALPVIEIHYGYPTDRHIPHAERRLWVLECRSCWGTGDELQYLGSFPTPEWAAHKGCTSTPTDAVRGV